MKMLALAAVAVASVVMIPTADSRAQQSYIVWGVGTKTCGAWTDMQRTDDAKSEAYQSWVHGFITGAAFGRNGLALKKDTDLGAEAVTKRIDAYCLANPLMTVERAAVDVLANIAEGG